VSDLRGTYRKPVPDPPPTCGRCRWTLAFHAADKSWTATCPNPECPVVGTVPASVNFDLIEFVRERGTVLAEHVAARFGWTQTNANNHLKSLMLLGYLDRRRVEPKQGGKRYEWRLT
jgi:hypothetical protein